MQLRLIQTNTAEYDAMVALRMKVLLDPIGIPRSYIDPVKEAGDLLIGAFEDARLIGCCILSEAGAQTMQLRQMAVDNDLQQKGVGGAIVRFAEQLVKERGYYILMMHARNNVMEFYKKCGYRVAGEQFTEVGIDHHRMEKQLNEKV
jgi:predicted GNAT family N-acyltransferase